MCACVCAVSAVEVWCTHLLPPQAAVPPPVQGTGPPSFCSKSCVLCQVPHSVSIRQCEVGELRRGLCAGSVSIFGNVVHLGVESELVEPRPSVLSVSCESVFMSWESQ